MTGAGRGIQRKTPARSHFRIAHRGASAHEPENTLLAFRRALELGADGLELDVHLSADGVPVVIHDASVDKTTDGTGQVGEMSLAEVRAVDAGKGEKIPLLEEVIDEFAGRCLLLIELKGVGSEIPTGDMIRAKHVVSSVIVSSFDPAKLATLKAHAPEIETGVLTGRWDIDFVELAEEANADCIQFGWERHAAPHTLLTDDVFRRAREAGLEVMLWHEERPEVIRELEGLPIYGVCGNAPELL
ncbi:glycerophosphodiester phosphodiesterase [Candidatus Poribacteria bacterium]|jgi:glycerophosphoryl diester phosphodiesterase|nr:glycerophosphodiester phosphodiesterase [Candidatus Poribacteria bacterium]MBT5531913.1 glycerophosphodiester phosphodiesterase [Candidatus Poribacteria bacterium]MBT5710375.1 glycerophosphodiester phosphodiesterase [Candidatus Poribacteria bacterium]MBT7099905.1 glycerophosphodiester phosphodiesterase [Candidatus Poribacteria bacterium]MBT7807973.1 glycerophosphodiester phosphodiesterase [Candidatus Poribacteria bacterium]